MPDSPAALDWRIAAAGGAGDVAPGGAWSCSTRSCGGRSGAVSTPPGRPPLPSSSSSSSSSSASASASPKARGFPDPARHSTVFQARRHPALKRIHDVKSASAARSSVTVPRASGQAADDSRPQARGLAHRHALVLTTVHASIALHDGGRVDEFVVTAALQTHIAALISKYSYCTCAWRCGLGAGQPDALLESLRVPRCLWRLRRPLSSYIQASLLAMGLTRPGGHAPSASGIWRVGALRGLGLRLARAFVSAGPAVGEVPCDTELVFGLQG